MSWVHNLPDVWSPYNYLLQVYLKLYRLGVVRPPCTHAMRLSIMLRVPHSKCCCCCGSGAVGTYEYIVLLLWCVFI